MPGVRAIAALRCVSPLGQQLSCATLVALALACANRPSPSSEPVKLATPEAAQTPEPPAHRVASQAVSVAPPAPAVLDAQPQAAPEPALTAHTDPQPKAAEAFKQAKPSRPKKQAEDPCEAKARSGARASRCLLIRDPKFQDEF